MDSKSSWSQQNLSGTASFGSELFTTMSEHCMELTSVKRQNSSQSHFKDLLGRLRLGNANYHDANTLLNLHLSNYSSQKRKQILNEGVAMHLFATKAPRNEHNYQRLSETSNEDNPVALVKAQWSSTRGLAQSTIAHTIIRGYSFATKRTFTHPKAKYGPPPRSLVGSPASWAGELEGDRAHQRSNDGEHVRQQ